VNRTLANTVRTWNSSGLLDMMSERVALLNDPLPQEHAIALQHGFDILQPKNIPDAKVPFHRMLICVVATL
jgi:hypothetical protein